MEKPELTGGIIFDIQGFSVHDGPGCRTLIFFKGCSLRCAWCSNPEGLNQYPEPLYNASKCIFDGLCIDACPYHAITSAGDHLIFNRDFCNHCTSYNCASACCTDALRIAGNFIDTEELFLKIQRDRQYWGSNGGITLTGGEPFLQPDFAANILKKCYQSYIHTAVETCGNIPWENIAPSLSYIDWIFYDLKHPDTDRHFSMTSTGNKLIFENAIRLSKNFKGRMIFRMPVIPGFNDDAQTIASLSEFIHTTGRDEINILPVHHLGREKYNLAGRNYYTDNFNIPGKEEMNNIRNLLEDKGIHCYIGSDTPF
ncbi:MAG: glycyl-radical enzyme activating protein [Bacteroidetes bacterium]|nr:glycyl-radical enzyme activating protein [Bacteroidota bacterium]